jgi:hypothetical protein
VKSFKTLLGTALLFASIAAQATPISPGRTYTLHDHPDGNERPPTYGLRLDGLLTGDSRDVYTFEFGGGDDPISLYWDRGADTIAISGSVWGGLNESDGYADGQATWWNVTYTYTGIYFCGNHICSNDGGGSISSDMFGSYDLAAESGNHSYAFQLLRGHRGVTDVSGIGWLNHCPSAGNPNQGGSCDSHLYASDWLFTLKPVPEPATLALMVFGLLGIAWARARRKPLEQRIDRRGRRR